MAEITTSEKQTRVRCSDELFLEAVFGSKTYAEISAKTGQKIATTMARYARTKSDLAKQGIDLPVMERAKPAKVIDRVGNMAEIVAKLKATQNN